MLIGNITRPVAFRPHVTMVLYGIDFKLPTGQTIPIRS